MITSFKVYSDDADEKRVLCADNLDKVLEILEKHGGEDAYINIKYINMFIC